MSCGCYQFGLVLEFRSGFEASNGDGTYEPIEWDSWTAQTLDASNLDEVGPYFPTFDITGFAAYTADLSFGKYTLEMRLTLTHSKIPVKITWDIYGDDIPDPTPGLGDYDDDYISSDEVTLNSGTPTHTLTLSPELQKERHIFNVVIKPCPWHV